MAPTQPYDLSDGAGIQAFDWNNSFRALTGSAVVSGAAVSINTGTLGNGNNTLTVAAGTVLVERTSHSIDSQSVDVNAGEGDPRWTVVAVDDTGTVTTIDGTPEEVLVAGESSMASHRAVERPAPPDLVGSSVTPLALIWVGANETEITSDEVFDARAPSDWHAGQLVVESDLDADTLDGHDSTDFVEVTDDIDADTLDGYEGSELAVLAENETVTGGWTFEAAATYAISGNDVAKYQDGSGGTNSAPYTFRFDDPRDFRLFAGGDAGVGDVLKCYLDGTVEIKNGSLDMQDNEVVNSRVENRTSDPSSPSAGREWLRTDL